MCQNWNFVINSFDTIRVNNFSRKLNTNKIKSNHLKKMFCKYINWNHLFKIVFNKILWNLLKTIRKIRLIQPMVITLEGGGGGGGGGNRVMVSFCKFKLCKSKRQFICKYIISNIKTIAYKLKSREERMQTQEFIVATPSLFKKKSNFHQINEKRVSPFEWERTWKTLVHKMTTPLGTFRLSNLNSSWGKCVVWLVD